VAQRHAELFEIGVGQFQANFRVDFALAKDRVILAEAEALRSQSPRPRANPNREKYLSLSDAGVSRGGLNS